MGPLNVSIPAIFLSDFQHAALTKTPVHSFELPRAMSLRKTMGRVGNNFPSSGKSKSRITGRGF